MADSNLKEFGFTLRQKEKIEQSIPRDLIKSRKNGSMTLSYLSGSTVIDLLNSTFDYMWNWEITKAWIESGVGKGQDGSIAHVLGRLTVFIKNDSGDLFPIYKEASGSKVLMGGVNQQDSCYKSAGTDALKKAASLLGIGLELWRDEDEEDYIYNSRLNDRFEEAWTPEMKEKHANSLSELSRYNVQIGVTKVAGLLSRFTNGESNDLRQIMPNMIDDFIAYIKNLETNVTMEG